MGFSAVNTGNNLLFLVVAGLLGFMAVTGYAGMNNIKQIIPELIPPEELFVGTPAPFRVLLHNYKKYTPSFLLYVSSPGNQDVLVPFVGGAAYIESTLNLTFHQRGRNRIGSIKISSPFPVNFFTRYWVYQLETDCIVFPRLLPMVLSCGSDGSEQSGNSSRRARGDDGELECIRGYSGNEPLRSIHWKHSARSEELLVKEFGSRSAPPLVIQPDALPGAELEEKVSHAAWLVTQLVMLQPVGLILDEQLVRPDSGRRQYVKLLTELALYGHR